MNLKNNILLWVSVMCAFALQAQISVDTNAFLYLTPDTGVFNPAGLPAAIGDEVQEWHDLSSGNNFVFFASDATRRPTLVESNGDRWINFDPGDFLLNNNTQTPHLADSLNGLTEFSFYISFQSDVVGVDYGLFHSDNIDGNDDEITLRYDVAGACTGNNNLMKMGIVNNGCANQVETQSGVQSTDHTVVSVLWNSGEPMYFYINGSLSDSSSVISGTTTVNNQFYIGKGAKDGNANNGWDGKIGTLIFYNTFHDSTTQVQQVNNYDTATSTPIVNPIDSTVLPVTWGSFSAQALADANQLQWQTKSEINNYGFEVQKWQQNEFSSLGFIRGNGTSSAAHQYIFYDESPNGTSQLYRLKQIDFDGRFSYSEVISVQRNEAHKSFLISPNPARAGSIIQVQSELDFSQAEIQLFNAKGELLQTQFVQTPAFKCPEVAGLYFVLIRLNNQIVKTKLIVQ